MVFRLVNFYNFFIATRKPVLSLLQPSFYLPPAPISFVESAAYCLNLLRFATSGVVLQPLRPSLLSSELAFAPWGAQDQLPLGCGVASHKATSGLDQLSVVAQLPNFSEKPIRTYNDMFYVGVEADEKKVKQNVQSIDYNHEHLCTYISLSGKNNGNKSME